MKKKILTSMIASFYLVAAIFGVSLSANAAGSATMDSTFAVANATRGDTAYVNSVSANVNEVVKYQVWYHNTEEDNSGLNAENLNIRVSLPTALGQSHTAVSTVAGTNTNTVTRNATVTTSVPTRLAYIPGTAVRRYNSGTNENPNWVTVSIPDTIVTSGYTIPSMNPCWNFQEAIYIQARVNASYLSIDKLGKVQGGPTWVKTVEAQPGDTVDHMINIKNEGNTVIHNVIVRDAIPAGLDYVEGSARLINGLHPNGIAISDTLVTTGVNIGDYNPNSNALVRYSVIVPEEYNTCGDVSFSNTAATTSSETSSINSTSVVETDYVCEVPTPPVTPPTTVVTTGKGSMPTSGPAEAAAGAVGLTTTGGAAYAWIKSKKNLLNSLKKIK